MTAVCMIYGATGYTGRLILDAALANGVCPVLAGRSPTAVRALAERHQLSFRVFGLDDPAAIAAGLEDVDVVLNAAGPFSVTAEPMARICLANGVHYLDICCELAVLERIAALDEPAREAGVALLPGAGLSPAVGETLALHLKRRLPGAVKLVIAVSHLLPPSAGLIRACLDIGPQASRALRRGRLKTMPRRRVRRFDFGRGPVRCYGLGWGELAAAHRATGVRNIDFFVQRRRDLASLLHMSPARATLYRLPPIRRRLDRWAAAHGTGPPRDLRQRARTRLLGYAYDAAGQCAVTRLHLPDLYTVTAELAVTALMQVMTEPPRPGVMTPTQYLGADFLSRIPGLAVDWEELEISAPGELPRRLKRHVPWWRRLSPRSGVKKSANGRASTGHVDGSGGGQSRTAAVERKPNGYSTTEDKPQAADRGEPKEVPPSCSPHGSGEVTAADDSISTEEGPVRHMGTG